MWLSFKDIFKEKKFIAILILILILWIILISIVYTTSYKGFNLANSDGYIILLQARTWWEGHPLRLNPEDHAPAGTSDYLYPLVLSIGYWLGFKSEKLFILWTYILNLFLILGSAIFLFRFFKRFFAEISFPTTLISVLFAPIFYNFFICTNFSLYFFLLSGALSFLGSLPFFLLFSILTSLSRPEGIIPYIFLSTLYLGLNNKQDWWKLILGILPALLLLYLNFQLTGQLMHQGAVSQSLFNYDSFFNVIRYGSLQFIDTLKGTLLGLYQTTEKFGISYMGTAIYTLPPLLFIFFIIGVIQDKKRWISIPSSIFLFLLIAGDSLSLFMGLHFNRHILPIFPILFAFSFTAVIDINKKIKGFYPAILIIFSLFFISQEILILSYIKNNIASARKGKEVAQWLEERLPEGTNIIDATIGNKSIAFELKNNKIIFITPNLNPIFNKHIDSFWRITEKSELIQQYYTDVKFLIIDKEMDPIGMWLKEFSINDPIEFSWIGEDEKFYLYSIDLSPLKKKRFSSKIIDEVDIGNPASESEHFYKRFNVAGLEVNILPKSINGVYDTGRITQGEESFYMKLPENGGELICLLGNSLEGRKFDLNRERVSFKMDNANYTVIIDGREIKEGKIENYYELIRFTLPPLQNKTKNIKITVNGSFVSYHYWMEE
jgi:hypothetical protein